MIKEMKPFLQKAWEKTGFTSYTTIQTKAIPFIMEGKDVVAESPTGTGKTLAYVMPLLQRLDETVQHPQIVIVSPTRELVMQIHSEVQKFTIDSPFSSASLLGGADVKRQIERLKKHPQIIVGSPGRIVELIRAKKLKMHAVKTIVFDEFDQLMKQNMMGSLQDIIKATMRDRQLLFFSATIPTAAEQEAIKLAKEPIILRIKRNKEQQHVKHLYVVGEVRDKLDNIRKIVHMQDVKAVAFMNDPFRLDDMVNKLKFRKVAAGVLHAEAKKQERAATLRDFRQGTIQIVLATDVAARGLDIEGLTHVLHLDLPDTLDQYIHRSGRTGRMGKEGTVISLVTQQEEKKLLQFAKKLGVQFEKLEIYKGGFVEKKPPVPKKKSKNSPKKPR